MTLAALMSSQVLVDYTEFNNKTTDAVPSGCGGGTGEVTKMPSLEQVIGYRKTLKSNEHNRNDTSILGSRRGLVHPKC